jgi:hypothetical protein
LTCCDSNFIEDLISLFLKLLCLKTREACLIAIFVFLDEQLTIDKWQYKVLHKAYRRPL